LNFIALLKTLKIGQYLIIMTNTFGSVFWTHGNIADVRDHKRWKDKGLFARKTRPKALYKLGSSKWL